jgi:hypothetical protein
LFAAPKSGQTLALALGAFQMTPEQSLTPLPQLTWCLIKEKENKCSGVHSATFACLLAAMPN